MAQNLAEEFKGDPNLKLVYVTQMTANGLEGQFNGIPWDKLQGAGYTQAGWIGGVERTAKYFADNFDNKAIAVEYHYVPDDNGNLTAIPAEKIIANLMTYASGRIGAAMWWLSGDTNYQSDLLNYYSNTYQGDLYCQLIGASYETTKDDNRFPLGYHQAFLQAQQLGARYVEPWEYVYQHSRAKPYDDLPLFH